MKWLDCVKNKKRARHDATEAAKPGSAAFVACASEGSQKTPSVSAAPRDREQQAAKIQKTPNSNATKVTKQGFAGSVASSQGHFESLQSFAATPAPASTTGWRAARDAYYGHHFACPKCSAVSQGYGRRCTFGARLWEAYQGKPIPDRCAQARERYLAELEAERELHRLLDAAMRACDYWGDDEDARAQMRQDCVEVPPEQQADLRDLFLREHGDGLFKQGENRDDDT